MKIAFLGSRGIPARYSGFETFYEQLATRLAARGHEVTVYNRSHWIRDVKGSYRGVRLVSLPSIPTKHLDTITHTLLSSLHALTQGYDIAYYSIVGNSPLAGLPRLAGARTLINVDGEDWARAKWGRFAGWYQRQCEGWAGRMANVIIADAKAVQARYRERYRRASVFVPYGANTARADATSQLAAWGLQPRRYLLYVGRFVPENAIDELMEAFRGVRTDMKLAVVGDAPYMDEYKRTLTALARTDPRIVLTGYVFGEGYAQLSSHAYLAVQPSGINGTRPALLDQMGFGNGVLVRDSEVNVEVIADAGFTFDRARPVASLRERLQELVDDPARVDGMRDRARRRVESFYNWERIADFHVDLFQRLRDRRPLLSYDEFPA